MSQFTETLRDLRLSNFALRHGQGQFDQSVFVGLDLNLVNGQKDDCRRSACPLIAVEEGMI
jgi:hypothetical protein